jgi:hypothetical protein
VLKYAIKNRQPQRRSAFTYCEDELPSHIDFDKSSYGGPFTTEQVEADKTFKAPSYGSNTTSKYTSAVWHGESQDLHQLPPLSCYHCGDGS